MISQTIAPLGRFIHVRSALKAEEAILYMLGHLPPDTSSILTATKTVPTFKLLNSRLDNELVSMSCLSAENPMPC